MVNRISLRAAVAFLMFSLAFSATAQDIEVSVDRYELARGETLTYTIQIGRAHV